MAKKIRTAPVNVSIHHWKKIKVVSDDSLIELQRVEEGDKEKMFIYKHTANLAGRPSTKIGLELPMPQSQIEKGLQSGSFEILS